MQTRMSVAISINSNIASLRTQRTLSDKSQALSNVFTRLTSGQRINSASDDAAGLSIADSLRTDARVYSVAIRNISDGISALAIAEGALNELSGLISRQLELAEQAANGTYSYQQRKSLNVESRALTREYNRIIQATSFNGVQLLDGTLRNDALRIQTGYGVHGSISAKVGDALSRVTGDGTFRDPAVYAGGNFPVSVALADVNNDGHIDMISGQQGGGQLSIYLNNGDGTFRNRVTYNSGNAPIGVEVADLNNDGRIDVIARSSSDATIYQVYLGNGNGDFRASTSYTLGSNISSLRIADLDNDGIMDLGVVNGTTNQLTILRGNGDGSYRVGSSYGLQTGGNSVEFADLNNDGLMDAIMNTSGGSSNGTTVRLGRGDGTFGDAVTTQSVGTTQGYELVDINDDDILDMVQVGGSTLFGASLGNGDGTFRVMRTYAIATASTGFSLAVGDLNGDGRADAAIASLTGNEVVLFMNNGDGSFTSPVTYDLGGEGRGIALGDLNSDGALDIAVSSVSANGMEIFIGNSRKESLTVHHDIRTQSGARSALAFLSENLRRVTSELGAIGSLRSRYDVAASTLSIATESLRAAESRIRDADIAAETARLISLRIGQQAATSIVGQANQQSAIALELLRA